MASRHRCQITRSRAPLSHPVASDSRPSQPNPGLTHILTPSAPAPPTTWAAQGPSPTGRPYPWLCLGRPPGQRRALPGLPQPSVALVPTTPVTDAPGPAPKARNAPPLLSLGALFSGARPGGACGSPRALDMAACDVFLPPLSQPLDCPAPDEADPAPSVQPTPRICGGMPVPHSHGVWVPLPG